MLVDLRSQVLNLFDIHENENQMKTSAVNKFKEFTFNFLNGQIHTRFKRSAESKCLIIAFHAAIPNGVANQPVFFDFPSDLDTASQLMIADPSRLIKNVSTSWYTGHEGFEVQSILLDLISSVVSIGGFERIVFFGASAGGYAALYNSAHFQGSVAIVLQPQTNIITYCGKSLNTYAMGLWPSLSSPQDWANKCCTDLRTVYSKPMENSIIYIQGAGDWHVRQQMLPFLNHISQLDSWNVVVNCQYWGKLGHSPIPVEEYVTWIKAAFAAVSTEWGDLLVAFHALRNTSAINKVSENNEVSNFKTNEIEFARLLKNFQLRKI